MRFTGGWKKLGPMLLDMIAFLPNPLLHVTAELMMAKLKQDPSQTAALSYMTSGNGIGCFHICPHTGEWRARWSSSCRHTTGGYSTYLPNSIEAQWRSHDIVEVSCSKANVETIFTQSEKRFRQHVVDHVLKKIEHVPCGVNRYQPNMLRGEGITQGRVGLYDKEFRRWTQQKLRDAVEKDEQVFIHCGAHWKFSMVWCFRKHAKIALDRARMEQLCKLMFATSVDVVLEHYPTDQGEPSIMEMRRLFGDFVIVGEEGWTISGHFARRNDSSDLRVYVLS